MKQFKVKKYTEIVVKINLTLLTSRSFNIGHLNTWSRYFLFSLWCIPFYHKLFILWKSM